MNQCENFSFSHTRRQWLQTAGCGFGAVAFHALSQQIAATAEPNLSAQALHHTPKAKRVIFLFMHGGVSQVDSFDPKPKLKQYDGKKLPFKGLETLDIALKDELKKKKRNGRVLDTTWNFKQHGGPDLADR